MLNFYTVIVVEVVFLMALLAFMSSTNDLFSLHKKKQFLALFLSVALGILAEWSGSVAATFGGEFREIVVWTKMVELSITPVVPFFCAEVLRPTTDASSRDWWIPGIMIVHACLEFSSVFSGAIYYVSADGVFLHGPFYWIYLVTYLGGALYVLQVGYDVSRQYQGRNKVVLILLLAFLLLGIAANQMDKSIKSAWLTVAIVITLFYIFYNDMLQCVDSKTMLLNSTSYKNLLARLRKPEVILMFDIDSFKAVNSEYGRVYGDQCLQTVGDAIRHIYGRYGTCFRIDDDEFCAVLNVDEDTVVVLNKQFITFLKDCRTTDPRLPRVSLGYACYDPTRDNAHDVEQAAASCLYREKARNKIRHKSVAHHIPEEPVASFAPMSQATADVATASGEGSSASAGLDTSGLTDWTFAAFSRTMKRTYLYLTNLNTQVARWSPAAVQYFDLPGEYMLGAGEIWESRIHPEDRKMYHDDIVEVLAGRKLFHEMEYRAKNRLGEYVVCTCRGYVLKGNGEEPDFFAGTITNHGIVDAVDSITNLHNEADFAKSIRRLIDERTDACVVEVDIENLWLVNAMYGQEGGNQVLRLFGIELRDLVAGRGQAFRLDGAKFAFYLNGADQDEVRELFSRLRRVAEEDIQVDDLLIPLRIYGGAVHLDHRYPRSEYVVSSSLLYAMEQSIKNYRNELVFSEDIHQMLNVDNVQLHVDIHRSAIDGCRNFFLCYQPIVSFETGKVIGAEALLRWQQEPYGLVPPDNFIPWLENDPAFIPVGNWILRQAIRETASLRQEDPDFILNVNIADTQLKNDSFREDVLNILAEENCPAENLCLELTERCRRLNPDFLEDELRFFRSRGVAIALDDFGTGMSSLALLLQLPIDELKVDRVFLLSALTDKRSRDLLETIVRSARRAGLRSCVEGIETQEQRDMVASLGGDCYQGYYATKPVPIEKFLEFCRKTREA